MSQTPEPKKSTEILDSVILAAVGLAVGIFFSYYFQIRGTKALAMSLCIPISFLAVTKGLKFGAMLSLIGAAFYGSFVLLRIVQGTAQAGFIREGIVNIATIVALGFILGIISETLKSRDTNLFRVVTTVETFVPDEDTGLYNFKSFRWMLSGEMKRVHRYNTPMSLVFLKIDNLAEFQKRYDYNQEIELFRETGRFLRALIRDADYIGKYSDSEIGVILPETNSSGVNIVMTRMGEKRAQLLDKVASSWNEIVPSLSLSSANFPKDASNLEELIDVIDARYQSF